MNSFPNRTIHAEEKKKWYPWSSQWIAQCWTPRQLPQHILLPLLSFNRYLLSVQWKGAMIHSSISSRFAFVKLPFTLGSTKFTWTVIAFCEMPLHSANVILLCLHVTLFFKEGSPPQKHGQQANLRCLLPAHLWNLITSILLRIQQWRNCTPLMSVTRCMAYALAVYLSYVLRDKEVCLTYGVIIRNGSCKQGL